MASNRVVIGLLTASALLFATLASNEAFVPTAMQPVPGDKWTYGLGSTTKEDGTPVRKGDTITPVQAIRLSIKDIAKIESTLKKCFSGSKLYQYEWDAIVDLSYNVGTGAVCKSSIPKKAKEQKYEEMCNTILDFYKVQGRDCRTQENKRFCGGVWKRRLEMNNLCLHGWPHV